MEFTYPPHFANPYPFPGAQQAYGWAQQEFVAGHHMTHPVYYPRVGGPIHGIGIKVAPPTLRQRPEPEPEPVKPPRRVYTEDILKSLQSRGRNPARTVIASDVYVAMGKFGAGSPQAPQRPIDPAQRRGTRHQQQQQQPVVGSPGRAGPRPNPRGGMSQRDHSAVCLDFLKGVCNDKRYKCKYVHPPMPLGPTLVEAPGESVEARQEVCDVWVLTGFCKFGEKCRFFHPILDESVTPVCSPAITTKMAPPRASTGRHVHPRPWPSFENVVDHSDDSNPEDSSAAEEGTPIHTPKNANITISISLSPADEQPALAVSPLGLGLDATVRRINGILNRITAAKFGSLSQQLLEMIRQSESCLTRALPLVFAKGCAEEHLGGIYAQVCKSLYEDASTPQRVTIGTTLLQLGGHLLYNVDEMVIALAGHEDQLSKLTSKRIGNIRFLGELFLEGLLHLNSVLEITTFLEKKSFHNPNKADAALHIELLCKFLSTIGEYVDTQYPGAFDVYYRNLQIASARHCTRVQVLIQNLTEWRQMGWRC